MSLLSECERFFKTKSLYDLFGIPSDASDEEIRKSFRRLSLKYHPDRYPDAKEDEYKDITARFQTLAKANMVLTDEQKRKLYDETGLVEDDDGNLKSEDEWMEYWRCLFPEITTEDIDGYIAKYIGSDEEKQDLKTLYVKYEGDLDIIYEYMIGYDEDRTREMLDKMLAAEEIPAFDNFVKEPAAKRTKRLKKVTRERKESIKLKKKMSEDPQNSLVAAIRNRRQNFDSMVESLEAKYCGSKSASETSHKAKKQKKAPKQPSEESVPQRRRVFRATARKSTGGIAPRRQLVKPSRASKR
ncbi:dnaJ homolog subfamily C member 9 [Brevipalpus obovatus]|uniref:dnaJ homolog subfamily C member 9 n=1 Tax=Brevipalpus obovatus TaxID=246614 RepID=UPI003D9E22B2